MLYHAWYYSWHLWIGQGNGSGPHLQQHAGGYHRLDQTGQSARHLFTLVRAADCDAGWPQKQTSQHLISADISTQSQATTQLDCLAFPSCKAVLSTGSDQDLNLAVQAMRWVTERGRLSHPFHLQHYAAKGLLSIWNCLALPCRNPITAASILGTGTTVGCVAGGRTAARSRQNSKKQRTSGASISATAAWIPACSVTTLMGIIVDKQKMEVVHQWR